MTTTVSLAKPTSDMNKLAREIVNYLNDEKRLIISDDRQKDLYVNILAYFIRYIFIPLPEPNCQKDCFDIALNILSTAPWMGHALEDYKVPLKNLTDEGILVFCNNLEEVKNALYLNRDMKLPSSNTKKIFDNFYQDSLDEHNEKRLHLNDDLGWAIGALEIKNSISELIEKEKICEQKKKLTIKLMAYHGATWFGVDRNFIHQQMIKYDKVFFHILLLIPKQIILCAKEAQAVNTRMPQ